MKANRERRQVASKMPMIQYMHSQAIQVHSESLKRSDPTEKGKV